MTAEPLVTVDDMTLTLADAREHAADLNARWLEAAAEYLAWARAIDGAQWDHLMGDTSLNDASLRYAVDVAEIRAAVDGGELEHQVVEPDPRWDDAEAPPADRRVRVQRGEIVAWMLAREIEADAR